jgi:hypothetical protein
MCASFLGQGVELFRRGYWGSAENNWVFWYVLLAMIALTISIISPNDPSSTIYKDISLFTMVGIGLALVAMKVANTRGLPFAFVGIGEGNIFTSGLLGLAVAMVFVGSRLFSFNSILSPLSVPSIGVLGIGALGSVFIISLYVSEMEETFRASFVNPTIQNAVSQFGPGLALVLLGVLLYFFLGFQTFGLFIALGGILLLVRRDISASLQVKLPIPTLLGLLASATVFASLHFLAYNADTQLLLSAFVFAILVDSLNIFNKNTVASRIAHTTNNGVLASVAAGLPGWIGLVIAVVHFGILYACKTTKVSVV